MKLDDTRIKFTLFGDRRLAAGLRPHARTVMLSRLDLLRRNGQDTWRFSERITGDDGTTGQIRYWANGNVLKCAIEVIPPVLAPVERIGIEAEPVSEALPDRIIYIFVCTYFDAIVQAGPVPYGHDGNDVDSDPVNDGVPWTRANAFQDPSPPPSIVQCKAFLTDFIGGQVRAYDRADTDDMPKAEMEALFRDLPEYRLVKQTSTIAAPSPPHPGTVANGGAPYLVQEVGGGDGNLGYSFKAGAGYILNMAGTYDINDGTGRAGDADFHRKIRYNETVFVPDYPSFFKGYQSFEARGYYIDNPENRGGVLFMQPQPVEFDPWPNTSPGAPWVTTGTWNLGLEADVFTNSIDMYKETVTRTVDGRQRVFELQEVVDSGVFGSFSNTSVPYESYSITSPEYYVTEGGNIISQSLRKYPISLSHPWLAYRAVDVTPQ